MDFSFSEEQEMLRRTARNFLTEHCPKSFVREMENDDKGYSPEVWQKMAELGWMGLVLPEQYGGVGGSFLDLVILLEEMGGALLPAPFIPTVVNCSLPLLHFGTEEQKKEFLPKIASGELIMTLALTEPNVRYDEAGIEVMASKHENDWVIKGTKLFVPDAHIAHYLLCAANTSEGIMLFLVDTRSPGIDISLLRTIAGDKQCEVTFHDVKVPQTNVLGIAENGWQRIEKILSWGAVAQCALISGNIQRVLDISVTYAKERVQFGKPIGSFQAIQHECAEMMTNIDGVKLLTYQAAWKLSQDIPATLEVSMAKAWTSDAARRVCLLGHAIHGGIGISLDHDMQLFFRRAKVMELAFGDGDFHREVVAEEMKLA